MHSAQPPQPSQLHFVDQIFEFKAQWSLHVLDSDGAGEGGGEGTGAEHSVQSPQPSQLHFLLQAVLGLAQNPLHAPCTRAGCITSHPTVILRAEAREPIVCRAVRTTDLQPDLGPGFGAQWHCNNGVIMNAHREISGEDVFPAPSVRPHISEKFLCSWIRCLHA